MMGRLAGLPSFEPRPESLLDLGRNIALGMNPEGGLVNAPRSRQQPQCLPPRIGNALPDGQDLCSQLKGLDDGHDAIQGRNFEFRISNSEFFGQPQKLRVGCVCDELRIEN